MPQKKEPSAGLWHSWERGYTPWDIENDRNLRKAGVFITLTIDDFAIVDVPSNPSPGDLYIIDDNASNDTTTTAEWDDIIANNDFWLDDTSLSTINNKILQWVDIPRDEGEDFPDSAGEQWELYQPFDGLVAWEPSTNKSYRFYNSGWSDVTDSFVDLDDTPSDYSGSDGAFVKVSGTEIVFDNLAGELRVDVHDNGTEEIVDVDVLDFLENLDVNQTTNNGIETAEISIVSLNNLSTDDLAEGSNNLYFTQTRARDSVSASGDLNYDSGTGVFSVTTYKSSDFDNDFSNKTSDDLTEGTTNLYRRQHVETFTVGSSGDVTKDTLYTVNHGLGTKDLSIDYYREDPGAAGEWFHLSGADQAKVTTDNDFDVAFSTDGTYKVVLAG